MHVGITILFYTVSIVWYLFVLWCQRTP